MKKHIFLLGLFLGVLVLGMITVGCSNGSTTVEHIHAYSETWTPNATQHWHECTAVGECDVKKKDIEDHVYSGDICSTCNFDQNTIKVEGTWISTDRIAKDQEWYVTLVANSSTITGYIGPDNDPKWKEVLGMTYTTEAPGQVTVTVTKVNLRLFKHTTTRDDEWQTWDEWIAFDNSEYSDSKDDLGTKIQTITIFDNQFTYAGGMVFRKE
jgi:hypothetical protein